MPALRSGLTVPLTKGDATSVLRKLESYDLIKEDMDNILELSQFPNAPDPLAAVSAKVTINFRHKNCSSERRNEEKIISLINRLIFYF